MINVYVMGKLNELVEPATRNLPQKLVHNATADAVAISDTLISGGQINTPASE